MNKLPIALGFPASENNDYAQEYDYPIGEYIILYFDNDKDLVEFIINHPSLRNITVFAPIGEERMKSFNELVRLTKIEILQEKIDGLQKGIDELKSQKEGLKKMTKTLTQIYNDNFKDSFPK